MAITYRPEPYRRVVLFPKAPVQRRDVPTYEPQPMRFRDADHPDVASRELMLGYMAARSRQHYRTNETPWWERRVSAPVVVATIIGGLVIGWLLAIPLIQAVSK